MDGLVLVNTSSVNATSSPSLPKSKRIVKPNKKNSLAVKCNKKFSTSINTRISDKKEFFSAIKRKACMGIRLAKQSSTINERFRAIAKIRLSVSISVNTL